MDVIPPRPIHLTEAVSSHVVLSVNTLAAAGVACCLALLVWWAYLQTQTRCSECGFCPAWCRCPH